MDFAEQSSRVIKLFNNFRNGKEDIHDVILEVCTLFSLAVDADLRDSDYRFLRYISSEIGVPQYYDLLCNKKNATEDDLQLSDVLSAVQDAELYIDEKSMLHRYQKEVYDKFQTNSANRFFLSAPTSFGKTFIVYEIIKKMAYNDIVLIFPTIALLGENYLKLLELKKNSDFWNSYSIHTLSDESSVDGKNLWIYTPERFMSFIDKHSSQKFDFIFIDEIYKIDNQYIIDVETVGENERDISFRVALFDTCLRAKDILLAGPYVSFPNQNKNRSLTYFLRDNDFEKLDYNCIEIVNKTYLSVEEKKEYDFDGIRFNIKSIEKKKKMLSILESILNETQQENKGTIIYCSRKMETENLAKFIIKNINLVVQPTDDLSVFIQHLVNIFGEDWVVVSALKHGIGIHHGLVPKYIQREIIRLFNNGDIHILLSTTTITEGINTTAKNMIVMSNSKGGKALKKFDAQNIAGRAGRFNTHYCGRVIAIDHAFLDTLWEEGDCLKHKSYDVTSKKTDVDLDISKNEYLTADEIKRKSEINKIASQSGLPEEILNSFKTVSKIDKVKLFKKIESLTAHEKLQIELFCKQMTYNNFNWDGFDTICNIIAEFVREDGLLSLITQKTKKGYALITAKVYYYHCNGLMGVINNEKDYYKRSTDRAIREAARMVFNTFRYQLTKYLGLFDLLYRYHVSQEKNIDIDDVLGINVIIQLLEYGSLVEKAKKANDYGVPYSIIRYYETEDNKIIAGFDPYESKVFMRIKDVL